MLEVNVMEKDYIRTPILQTLRKSPFEGLQQHFKNINSGINYFEKAVKYYLDGNYTKFKECAIKVNQFEHKADLIKGNIRNHLPKFVFLPIDKGDFLMLLKELDGILDAAKDVTVLMDMRETKVPEDIKPEFLDLTKITMEIVDTTEEAMNLFHTILETSFGGKLRNKIKKVIHEIHRNEHESDVIEKKISKHLFNQQELDPIGTIHLLKIVDRFGFIPDHAENAGDRIRAMLAK